MKYAPKYIKDIRVDEDIIKEAKEFRVEEEDLLRKANISKGHMGAQIQVKCINKSDRYNPHERILSIGGTNPDGSRWKLSEQDAIAGIEMGKWQFYVNIGEKSAWVIIALSAQGHKYLKTEADGEHPNNLLSLPECP
jgi:hypothetical protein